MENMCDRYGEFFDKDPSTIVKVVFDRKLHCKYEELIFLIFSCESVSAVLTTSSGDSGWMGRGRIYLF